MNKWADEVIKQHAQTTRRMMQVQPNSVHLNSPHSSAEATRRMFQRAINLAKLHHQINMMRIRRNGPTRNKILAERAAQAALGAKPKPPNREKFGIRIPNTIEEALKFDREAGNHKWAEAIKKEMDNLTRLNVFKFHPADKQFPKSEGWQKAPLRMIFDVKTEDKRHKARLVCGGHFVDSSGHDTNSSQVDAISVMLLLLIAQHAGLTIMTCDISDAFVTAKNSEKVWAVAGKEFGDKEGAEQSLQEPSVDHQVQHAHLQTSLQTHSSGLASSHPGRILICG